MNSRPRTLLATLAATAAALTLAACGGGSSGASTLSVDDVVPRLTDAGIECTDSSVEALEDGVVARAVTCLVGTTGAVVVAVADTVEDFDEVKSTLCADAAGRGSESEIAYGANWLAVAASDNNGVTTQQAAEALGGESSNVADFCG
jgi:phage-related minor tail protein